MFSWILELFTLWSNSRSSNREINFNLFERREKLAKEIISYIHHINVVGSTLYKEDTAIVTGRPVEYPYYKFHTDIQAASCLFKNDVNEYLDDILIKVKQLYSVESELKINDQKEDKEQFYAKRVELIEKRRKLVNSIIAFNDNIFEPYLSPQNFHKNLLPSSKK